MKKGLTILTAAFAVTTLFGCKGGSTPTPETSKITSVKVQAIPYALNNMPYRINATVEGEGKFSTEVTWTTDNENAHVYEGFFIYSSAGAGEAANVTVTATSVQDKTKYATAKIDVQAAQELTIDDFLSCAETGDTARATLRQTQEDIMATPSKDDFVYVSEENPYSPVTSVKYLLREGRDIVKVTHETGSKMPKIIPTKTILEKAFNNQYKDYVYCFSFTDAAGNECYGYCVDKPALTETEQDLFLYCAFDGNGLPIYDCHIEGGIVYSYLNLTPQLQ